MTKPVIQIAAPPLSQPIVDSNGLTMAWYMFFNALYNFILSGSSTIADADVTMIANATYVVNSTSRINLTLPNKFTINDEIIILGQGTGGWKILQNAGQTIHGTTSTTTGTGGSISSSARYNSITIRGIVPNTDFTTQCHEGTLSIV